jgi:hypothetical protein
LFGRGGLLWLGGRRCVNDVYYLLIECRRRLAEELQQGDGESRGAEAVGYENAGQELVEPRLHAAQRIFEVGFS